MGALGPEQRKEPRYKVAYHTYLASGRRLSYTLSVERVVDCKYVKRSLLVWQIFATCRLRHAHVRKDTRLSPLRGGWKLVMASLVPRPHLRERGSGDIRLIPRASLKLITFWREISLRQSHCRKDNLQCYTGNSWLLQHDDTALFWRVN